MYKIFLKSLFISFVTSALVFQVASFSLIYYWIVINDFSLIAGLLFQLFLTVVAWPILQGFLLAKLLKRAAFWGTNGLSFHVVNFFIFEIMFWLNAWVSGKLFYGKVSVDLSPAYGSSWAEDFRWLAALGVFFVLYSLGMSLTIGVRKER